LDRPAEVVLGEVFDVGEEFGFERLGQSDPLSEGGEEPS
jgi:hypothetical protein